jgi:hypothetical protein
MACLEGMVSKQNLQQRRSLILLADTHKKRARARDSRPRGRRPFTLTIRSYVRKLIWVQSACRIPDRILFPFMYYRWPRDMLPW